MKRCPECRRDYYDDSLLYCLDDGNALLDGPAASSEHATAILPESATAILPVDDVGSKKNRFRLPHESTSSEGLGTGSLTRRGRIFALIGVAAFLIVGGSLAYRYLARVTPEPKRIASIAVLPFENVSHDQNTEYLSDGITDSMINALSRLPGMTVIARSSVFKYKSESSGRNPDLKEVAHRLGVQGVVTGRVLIQGDTLDVRAELTDPDTNRSIWGEHFVRRSADIFAVQDEIARHVAEALSIQLTGAQLEQVSKRYTNSAEAYRLYLQGRYFEDEGSELSMKKALSYFDQAIALDPRYALAYAARAQTFFDMGDVSLPMSEARVEVQRNVAEALDLDENLIEARTILANLEFQYDWNFTRAGEDFRRVIATSPNYAEAHHQYMYYLALTGRPLDGAAEIKLAQQLDPVNPQIVADSGLPYYFARQYDLAIAENRKAVEMFPNLVIPHMALGTNMVEKGEVKAGIDELEKARSLDSNNPIVNGNLSYAYAKAGLQSDARRLIAELSGGKDKNYVPSYWLAKAYVGLNDKDQAFASLEKAYKERSWWLVWLKMDPAFDSLRDDPRFKELLRRVNLPE